MPAEVSADYDIITVGAASPTPGEAGFGIRFLWTHGGPAVSVHAPGSGLCLVDRLRDPISPWEGS